MLLCLNCIKIKINVGMPSFDGQSPPSPYVHFRFILLTELFLYTFVNTNNILYQLLI